MEFFSPLYLNGGVKKRERKKREGIRPPPFLSRDPPHSAPPCLTPPPAPPPPNPTSPTRWNQSLCFTLRATETLTPTAASAAAVVLRPVVAAAAAATAARVEGACRSAVAAVRCSRALNNGSRRLGEEAAGESVTELKGMCLWGICGV